MTLHLKYRHNQTPKEYKLQFPNAEIFSADVKRQMRQSNKLTGTTYTLEEKYGAQKANEIKAKIGIKSGASRVGKKRPQQSESIKRTWGERKDEWVAGITKAARTEQRRAAARTAAKARILKNGYHLTRGKETKLELKIRLAVEAAGYETIKQKGTKLETLGTIRFFDLFVPTLNLLIECDGEWWHCRKDRIDIDLAKTEAARLEGFKLLRVTDKQVKLWGADFNRVFLSLLKLDEKTLYEKSLQIIQDRIVKLDSKC